MSVKYRSALLVEMEKFRSNQSNTAGGGSSRLGGVPNVIENEH